MTIYVETKDTYSLPSFRFGDLASIVILVIGIVTYLFNSYQRQNEILDDAYISFRFAEHLAGGYGLVWNVGGEPVEGYTSLLHVSLLAAASKLGISLQTASNGISVASVIGTVLLLAATLRRQFGSLVLPAVLVIAIYLADPATAFHSISGLETQLFVLILCLAYFISLSLIESPTRRSAVILALVVFFSVLCRPEGLLNGFATYSVLFIYSGVAIGHQHLNARRLLSSLLISVVLLTTLGTTYAAAKYSYFGYLLPNSFYVKSNRTGLNGWYEVLQYLKHVATWISPLLIGSVFTRPLAAFANSLRMPAQAAKILLTITPPMLALLYYSTIVHEVGGAHRFSYPTYFYIVIAVAAYFSVVKESSPPTRRHGMHGAIVASICLVVLITNFDAYKFVKIPWQKLPPDDFHQHRLLIANALESTGLGEHVTIISIAAGVIPYVTHFNHIDPVGLTDNVLSGRTPLTPAEREAYLWSTKADVYIGFEPQASAGALTWEDDPRMQSAYVQGLSDPARFRLIGERVFFKDQPLLFSRMENLADNYYWVGEIEWPGWYAWKLKSLVYVRNDSPHFDELVKELEKITLPKPSEIELD